ncbi:MAG: hypothetical protein A2427_04905 [Candidatus Nealsonbacteria bacterium RIFOXYC1_FULL_40_7]|uniref:Uncharacterized protein n=1 Tax=Candidatus Nealsonbacteria bacterium RIFOXYC1_FULL_40_7 TaxID=1801678 RepID=A0A1G2EQ30_9BACT|nr:MAG: hypothetical protein A2427_04905 [Candidatus Nealsonbacteria bacterium RIFOXYC1_FULL_40_7]OGZ29629.1 MAG: hypothetical protein A2562_03920 [Candidatus Nealsonbacteria bacterium RIFOXYD1_FULL_39_11]
MNKKLTKTNYHDNDFIKQHVTDGVYRKIVKELSEAEDLKGRGRKLELTAEKLHNFLFYLSMGASYKNAAEWAQIPESTRQKYMTKSEEFRRVSSLAKVNVEIIAIQALYWAMVGRKPGYYEYIHPITKESTYVLLGAVQPNLKVCMWWLDKSRYFEKREEAEAKEKGSNQLGAPRNEEEARLLEELLNRHYDYVKRKEQEARLNNAG